MQIPAAPLFVCLVALACGFQVAAAADSPSEAEQRILKQLERNSLGHEETLALLKRLGVNFNADGLSVASLLEHSRIELSKCSQDKLLARHLDKSLLGLEAAGELEAVFSFLDSCFERQVDLCLANQASQLDKLYLGRFEKGTRARVERLNELVRDHETRESRQRLGPLERTELAQIAAGKLLQERQELGRSKLLFRTRKSRARSSRKELHEACADAVAKLRPLTDFLHSLEAYQRASEHKRPLEPKLAHWREIAQNCDRFNRPNAPEFQENERDNMPDLSDLSDESDLSEWPDLDSDADSDE